MPNVCPESSDALRSKTTRVPSGERLGVTLSSFLPPAVPTRAPDWASRIVTGPEQVRHEGEPAPAAMRVPVGFVTKEKSLTRATFCGLLPGAIRRMAPSRRKRSAFARNQTIW